LRRESRADGTAPVPSARTSKCYPEVRRGHTMLGDGALSFREFVMRETLPLAVVHDAVLEFLRGRQDAVLQGAQAVNAFVDEARMTQDVDVLSVRAADLAEEIRTHLAARFTIATRIRVIGEGIGYRVYQVQKPKNRHLVDVRGVDVLPPSRVIDGLLVLEPPDLIAAKVRSMVERSKTAKGATDLADLRRLLLAFPELKQSEGEVAERLRSGAADEATMSAWRDLAAQDIQPPSDDDF